MSENKHAISPTPWHFDKWKTYVIIDNEGRVITDVISAEDAELIASAPEQVAIIDRQRAQIAKLVDALIVASNHIYNQRECCPVDALNGDDKAFLSDNRDCADICKIEDMEDFKKNAIQCWQNFFKWKIQNGVATTP